MTRDSGYTLVEMLAALAVIGLAFGGLSAGVSVLGRHQISATKRIVSGEDLAAAQAGLEAALSTVKIGDILSGNGRRLEISCATGAQCNATGNPDGVPVSVVRAGGDRVSAIAANGYSFAYMTSVGPAPTWSSAGDSALFAVVLQTKASGNQPVAVMRLRQEQAFRCEYDVVIASCREPTL